MRTNHSHVAGLLASLGLVLGLAGAANAQTTIDFGWISTSGSGMIGGGGSSLTGASIGDTAVMEIRVSPDLGGIERVVELCLTQVGLNAKLSRASSAKKP